MNREMHSLTILLHGLASHGSVFWLMSRRLRSLGHHVKILNYPSLLTPIDHLGEWFSDELDKLDSLPEIANVNVVAHSMGSIITREAMRQANPSKLHRVVMLAPPNRGSRIATIASRAFFERCQPLCQLSDDPTSFVNCLDEPDGLELGIIAAGSDRVVSHESTCLNCQTDHLTIPGSHTGILFRKQTVLAVDAFLKHGNFNAARADAAIASTFARRRTTPVSQPASKPSDWRTRMSESC